jgi:hypothetical protein
MLKHFGHMSFQSGSQIRNVGDGELEFPYVGHDTNVAIESYHANLKATLRATKSQLSRRQVD